MADNKLARRDVLIVLTTALLPFTFLPHELGLKGFPIATVVLVLVLLIAATHRGLADRWTPPEVSLWLLAVAITARLLLTVLEGFEFPFDQFLSSVGGVVAAILLLRLGRRADLRRAFTVGLRFALVLMLLFEAYQLTVGLSTLQSAGYIYPDFIYHTESGTYRPFGTFRTPVTYGAYLAMVGLAVTLTAQGLWRAVALAATVAGLVATETRSAWIAFAAAGLAVVLAAGGALRRRTTLLLIVAAWGAVVVALASPGIFDSFLARIGTLTDASYSSNSTRVSLWGITLAGIAERPLEGFGLVPLQSLLPAEYQEIFSHPHNNYLLVLFVYGLIGFVPFAAFLITAAYSFRRRNYMSTAGLNMRLVGIGALAVFALTSLFESTWSTFSVFATLGLLVGMGMPPSETVSYRTRTSSKDVVGRRL
tara:strand:+ start:5713 stop:6978 length:1266 start_codon:yes stop_codon:yes gene_type:complete